MLTTKMTPVAIILMAILCGQCIAATKVGHSLSHAARGLRGLKTRSNDMALSKRQARRRTAKKGGGSGGSSGSSSGGGDYLGCLNMTDEMLADTWTSEIWNPPTCSYVHHDDGTDGDDSNGDDDDDDDDGKDGDDDDQYYSQGDEDGDGDDGDYVGGDDGNGDDDDDDDYDVVVTNEDVSEDGSEYDVYADFNVTECETYSNLWVWDLALSCEDNIVSVDSSCNCSFAESLFDQGLLSCEDESLCPSDCPVCATCLSILGCNVTSVPPDFNIRGTTLTASVILFIVAAALTMLIIAIIIYRARRNPKVVGNDLTTNLMDGEMGRAVPGQGDDPMSRYDEELSDIPYSSGGAGFVAPVVLPLGGASADDDTTTTSDRSYADMDNISVVKDATAGLTIGLAVGAAGTDDASVCSEASKDTIEFSRVYSVMTQDTIERSREEEEDLSDDESLGEVPTGHLLDLDEIASSREDDESVLDQATAEEPAAFPDSEVEKAQEEEAEQKEVENAKEKGTTIVAAAPAPPAVDDGDATMEVNQTSGDDASVAPPAEQTDEEAPEDEKTTDEKSIEEAPEDEKTPDEKAFEEVEESQDSKEVEDEPAAQAVESNETEETPSSQGEEEVPETDGSSDEVAAPAATEEES